MSLRRPGGAKLLGFAIVLCLPASLRATESRDRPSSVKVNVGADAQPFSPQWLRLRAKRLAERPFVRSVPKIPDSLAAMNYDQYRQIRFRPEASVWRGENLGFELQLFHVGHFYDAPVAISVVDRGRAKRLAFDRALFDYGANHIDEPLPEATGFAGFRVHAPLNRRDHLDELLVFLGASYFRALGRGNAYGLSSRGLAIDTALPGGEVFPVFREFFIERPRSGAKSIVVHALLDSPHATGAYRFDVRPGESTEVRVTAKLFFRTAIERLGIAPLSSMYLHGENDRTLSSGDFRPESHDSDGLLVWFGNGERLWRPLQNPDILRTSVLRAEALKGFGLYQRDRDFGHYEDLDAHYERRPSVWIEPEEGFGPGAVYLIEIPTKDDIHDNIVAFFTPDAPLVPGKALSLAYRMLWGARPGPKGSTQAARATHVSRSGVEGVPAARAARRFAIDFAGADVPSAADGVEAVVTVASGHVHRARVQAHPDIGGLRALFDFTPDNENPVEMRCFLRDKGVALSETWSYLHAP